MTYTLLLQVVSLTLALFGAFYKKTTVSGPDKETIYRHGLPVLTPTGKVLLLLILTSFSLTAYSSYRGAKTAKEENDKLQSKLDSVDQNSANILKAQVDEQRRNIDNFANLLHSQETTGQATINTVNKTAGTLQTKVDSSFGLLNQTAVELNRAANPIVDLGISFSAYVPLNHPGIAAYGSRLVSAMNSMRTSGLDTSQVYVSQKGENGEPSVLGIDESSSLLPRGESEEAARWVLRTVGIKIALYKGHVDFQQLVLGTARAPDLTYTAFVEADVKDGHKGTVATFYELNQKECPLRLDGTNMPPFPERSYSNGTIRSILDLSGTQMVVRFDAIYHPGTETLANVIDDVRGEIQISWVKLTMSGGREFLFRNGSNLHGPFKDRQGHFFYIVNSFSLGR